MNKKVCRKVNRRARELNRQLEQDVFGNRFWIREYCKQYVNDVHYFLCTNLEIENNLIEMKLFQNGLMNFNY